ncbi:MAG: hypothetical protein RJB02_1232 [Pseudomonadota bacterium]
MAGSFKVAATAKTLHTKPSEQIAVKMFGSCSDASEVF